MTSVKDIEKLGLSDIKKVYHNLNYNTLFQHEMRNEEGVETTKNFTMNVDTGDFTGRSPDDKYFVRQDPSKKYIAWGNTNRAIHKDYFDELFIKVKEQLSGKNIYIQDAYCGASATSRRSVRFVTEVAWQAHFVKNMFIRPDKKDLAEFTPDFTVYNACKFKDEEWAEHGLRKGGDGVFVLFNIEENIAIIGGTWYGGEMKKGIFSMMNYWLPLEGKLGMHCSANIGKKDDDVALFFGLSGTGKTTLSTDPKRRLIGDDEHGWDEDGVFNFEGGCYAKCADLREKAEPEIFHAIKRDALLENVTVDTSGNVDFAEKASRTANTRVSYPIYHIDGYQESMQGGHPKNIIFLTADAYGVLPPVSKLTRGQAMYYFLSGYTAKVAGTERGVKEPQPNFSACFGEPFLPLHPTVYAQLLGEKMDKHKVNVYLVNTGWSGGAYGIGKRISIADTRNCVNAILDGTLENCEYDNFEVFNLATPKAITGVNSKILDPKNTWRDKAEYDRARKKLARKFKANFKKYTEKNSEFDFSSAGPV